MTYVITEACTDVMDRSCVGVCPVACIHPEVGEPGADTVRQLFINPRDCIDCDACLQVCPVDAIYAQEDVPETSFASIAANAAHFSRR